MSSIDGGDVMMWLWVIASPAFFVGARFGLRKFHHFVSLNDYVHLSDFGLFLHKWKFALGAGVILTCLVWLALFLAAIAATVVYSKISMSLNEPSGPDSSKIVVEPSTPSKGPGAAIPTAPQEPPPAPVRQQDPVPTAQVPSPAMQTPDPTSPSQMTKEEVERLEKEKQYSGDDPIVRKRLGLPPKPQ